MFEKEAGEYKNHFENELYLFDNTDIFPSDIKEAYQKGAEFGYNKANEWQYVKDGKYPKDDKGVLVYREGEEPQLDYYLNEEGYVGWKSEKWDREYYARKGENPPVSSIIAWKEIVLPEIIK